MGVFDGACPEGWALQAYESGLPRQALCREWLACPDAPDASEQQQAEVDVAEDGEAFMRSGRSLQDVTPAAYEYYEPPPSEDVVVYEPVTSTKLRLQGSATRPDGVVIGLLQVYHSPSRTWGGVCVQGMGDLGAQVACKQMGFAGGIQVNRYTFRHYVGTLPFENGWDMYNQVLLGDLACNGTETDIAQCGHSGWGDTDCDKFEWSTVLLCRPKSE